MNRGFPAPAADIIIGGAAKGAYAFIGDLDEVQLSNVARSAGWIKTEFESQKPESVLSTCMEEEAGSGQESLTIHMLKVIIRINTLDGWMIIGAIVCMGIASVYVFRRKMWMFSEIRNGNAAFSEAFRRIKHPLELFENGQEFRGSFYRIYRAGCEEWKLLQELYKKDTKEEGGSYERIIKGCRSAIENEAVMESRRLASGMLIISFSISGAPFLGLLGTVWGIMNTFAGLAESQEASLTAFAPGVAAALSTTVAGLLIEIPTLFFYTYLAGIIKNFNGDVKMFVEKMAFKLEEGT